MKSEVQENGEEEDEEDEEEDDDDVDDQLYEEESKLIFVYQGSLYQLLPYLNFNDWFLQES